MYNGTLLTKPFTYEQWNIVLLGSYKRIAPRGTNKVVSILFYYILKTADFVRHPTGLIYVMG